MFDNRIPWDEYFMQICDIVAARATCDRKHVGAVIVRDRHILSTGYNGSIPGASHCDEPDNFWICLICNTKVPYIGEQIRYCPACVHHVDMHLHHGGHDMEENHCVRTIHAELNAICHAAREGIKLSNTSIYCNTLPCWSCFKAIVSAGITEVVWRDSYRIAESKVIRVAQELNFNLRQLGVSSDHQSTKPLDPGDGKSA